MKQLPLFTKARFAFTLSELILVVAICSVLLAMFFPVTGFLRAKSQRMGCMANLRTIGAALFAYAGDHNGNLPFQSAEQRYWYAPYTLAVHLVGARGAAGYLEWDPAGGARSSKALLCPGDPNARLWKESLGYPRSYMYRQTAFSTEWETQPMKLNLKSAPNHKGESQETVRRWLVTDRWTSVGAEAICPYPKAQETVTGNNLPHPDNWTISSYWHKDGANILYEDGGVEWKRFGEVLGE